MDLLSSGMKIFFVCMFGFWRRVPQGLNWVARTRFEYDPATFTRLLVIGHVFAIVSVCYHGGYKYAIPMAEINPFFYIIVLIMSVVIHEIAHGYAALRYGDHTAEYQGRLTLNPLKHLDLYGSIVLPLLLVLSHAPFLIGWAKPVPYNPDNFRPEDRRIGSIWVASAGILTNIAIAIFMSIFIRIALSVPAIPDSVIPLAGTVVLVNIVLSIFNLMPIPPLDGSKILFGLLGYKSIPIERFMEKYSFVFILIFIFFLWQFISPVIFYIFTLMTGLA